MGGWSGYWLAGHEAGESQHQSIQDVQNLLALGCFEGHTRCIGLFRQDVEFLGVKCLNQPERLQKPTEDQDYMQP